MGDETQRPAADEEDSSIDEGPFRPGDIVADKYRVDRVVGIGGMGQVVAATHVDLGQDVAIKILRRSRARDSEAVERFLCEAHAAVRLKSTHVARVFDVGTTSDGLPYIVMELLEGCDLCTVLERNGLVPTADAVDFVLQACDAVAEAHARGIVHRDLKPENLFLTTRRDGRPCIKVLDFGISKMGYAGAPRRGRRALTQDDVIMGSPGYMSPEQVKSSKNADQRSDIWSLGVTLYELLTGREPFCGESTPDVFVSVLTSSPPPPSSIVPQIPPGLSAVVMRCLAKDPLERFQDVAALAQSLMTFATRTPISVAPSWTSTSPEFRVPGPGLPPNAPPSSTPITPAGTSWGNREGPPSSKSMPYTSQRLTAGGVPPAGGPAMPPSSLSASAGPAGISTTIRERRAKASRSFWAYGLAGVAAALVAAGVVLGVTYQRAHKARAAAALAATPPEPPPSAATAVAPPAAASSVAAATPPATLAAAAASSAARATKPGARRFGAPPAVAPKPTGTASSLPRHRTAW